MQRKILFFHFDLYYNIHLKRSILKRFLYEQNIKLRKRCITFLLEYKGPLFTR